MLVFILTGCLTIYGSATFQNEEPQVGLKTLSGREIERDPLQTADGLKYYYYYIINFLRICVLI